MPVLIKYKRKIQFTCCYLESIECLCLILPIYPNLTKIIQSNNDSYLRRILSNEKNQEVGSKGC